jgi:hypothetical protein
MVTNRKNMIPEPNIRKIIDAALDSWLDLSLGKKLRIGDMGYGSLWHSHGLPSLFLNQPPRFVGAVIIDRDDFEFDGFLL